MMLVPQFLNNRAEHFLGTIFLSINCLLIANSVGAQIVPDKTLNTQVNLREGQHKITGGMELGKNLFHSFEKFSPNAEITHFDNNSYIQNIFTRVTGNSASLIEGLIKTNDNASLFLINPSGIIFGNNAKIDVGGSFITTTAESIIFSDGTIFDTKTSNTPPLLTVSIPSGLQYGSSPKAISSNNTEPILLGISPGNTIAFLGGNIDLNNFNIDAVSGNVEISGVSGNETISLRNNINRWEFNYDGVKNFNDIRLSQGSTINNGGELGIINLRGKDIILSPGVNIENSTNTDDNGGDTSLVATNYIDFNNILLSNPVGNPLEPSQDTGRGGDIIIQAKKISIRNGSVISSTTPQGIGGDITINAIDSTELSGFNEFRPSLILSSVIFDGEGGNVYINTGKLSITDGSRIDSSSFGDGKAGNIEINAYESIFISQSKSFFNGNFNQEVKFNSGLVASSGFENVLVQFAGISGSVTVHTPQLSIEDGGEISVSNFGTGNAGNININIEDLLLNDNSQISAKTASGNGGSIEVNGSEIVLRDDASIATTAGGNGDGGNITLAADNIVMFDESTINADANLGSGGNITITTQSLLTQDNPENAITASSELGIDGIVIINTPDTNSKIETTQQRRSPLAGEESIYTGCSLGTDFSANKFSYIGRGGMRKGPFDALESPTVIADLGIEDSGQPAAELNLNNLPQSKKREEKSSNSITEATAWIINAQGNVELIAQASNNALSSECLFN